jgi:fucose permease
MPVILPLLSHGFGGGPLNKEQLGRIAAVTFIGVIAGLLIGGPLANRYPVKWFTASGCFFIALGLGMLGAAATYAELLVAVGIMGFGGGILDMILSPVVCAIQPDRRTTAMNWLHSFYCIGAVLTVLIATLALVCGWKWQVLALTMTGLPILVGLLFLFIPLPPLLAEPVQRLKVRALIFHRFFLLALAAIFLGGATEMGMAQWLPAFAELDLGFSRAMGGSSLLAFSIAMALGRMGVGLLDGRWSTHRIMAWSAGLTGVLFLAAGCCPAPLLALTAAVLAGFTGSCLWPSTLALAADRYPRGGASMFGLLAAVGNFGGVFMPWGVGLIADASSIGRGLAATALCPLLLLLALRELARPKS